MSRASRPLRRVRDADRARLVEALASAAGDCGSFVRRYFSPVPAGERMTRSGEVTAHWLGRLSRHLGCRPAQLRRCLLGRVVSARAAAKILNTSR